MARSAGPFGVWASALVESLDRGTAMDVPYGPCTACCEAAQFIHVGADESATRARIPRELLFPAPGPRRGDLVLGYDRNGRCPMLVDGACSIYEHRPRTCRIYDCRIFAASGQYPAEPEKAAIARTASEWVFEHSDPADAENHRRTRTAAEVLTRAGAGEVEASLRAIRGRAGAAFHTALEHSPEHGRE